jgi:hypothetical protein
LLRDTLTFFAPVKPVATGADGVAVGVPGGVADGFGVGVEVGLALGVALVGGPPRGLAPALLACGPCR